MQPERDEYWPQVPETHLGGRVCKKGCTLGSPSRKAWDHPMLTDKLLSKVAVAFEPGFLLT